MTKGSIASTSGVVILDFKLKHFRSSTIKYILKKTGYSSLTEYEDMCYPTDKFTHIYTMNTGAFYCDYSHVDYKLYRIFHLSIHNLNEDVRKYVLTKFIGMDQVDYELFHSEKNRLYVVVPYKNEESRLASTVLVDLGMAPGVESEEKVEVFEKYEDLPEINSPITSEDLFGWTFKMNEFTKNSYVLIPPKKIQLVKDRKVCWGDSKLSIYDWSWTPTTWHLPIESLQRPIYYNNSVGGWIVSLRYRSQLLDAGVKEQK